MTNTLHFSGWINCISAQLKVNLCAPGAPKGPKVGMSVRQYEMLCANYAGRAPRKYPVNSYLLVKIITEFVKLGGSGFCISAEKGGFRLSSSRAINIGLKCPRHDIYQA